MLLMASRKQGRALRNVGIIDEAEKGSKEKESFRSPFRLSGRGRVDRGRVDRGRVDQCRGTSRR